MTQYRLGGAEAAFATLIWDNEPLSSSRLVELCARELEWKKSTTYTVLRRLCQKGIVQNENGVVTARVSREELAARQSEAFVDETFGGSLPRFLAAFTRRKKLSEEEVVQLQRLIDENRGGGWGKPVFYRIGHESHRVFRHPVCAAGPAGAAQSAQGIFLRPVGGGAVPAAVPVCH